jgi:hypothetical protein
LPDALARLALYIPAVEGSFNYVRERDFKRVPGFWNIGVDLSARADSKDIPAARVGVRNGHRSRGWRGLVAASVGSSRCESDVAAVKSYVLSRREALTDAAH